MTSIYSSISIETEIDYSYMLSKLATIIYSLCLKKQTLEILLYLSFKV